MKFHTQYDTSSHNVLTICFPVNKTKTYKGTVPSVTLRIERDFGIRNTFGMDEESAHPFLPNISVSPLLGAPKFKILRKIAKSAAYCDRTVTKFPNASRYGFRYFLWLDLDGRISPLEHPATPWNTHGTPLKQTS